MLATGADGHWTAAGDTCGIALWSNRDHTVAVSVLLNGLESLEDFGRIKGILPPAASPCPIASCARSTPPRTGPSATLHYSRNATRFRQLTGIIPLLARSYFDLFGTPA